MDSPQSAQGMLEKVRLLSTNGLATADFESISQMASEVLSKGKSDPEFRAQFLFSLNSSQNGHERMGLLRIRYLAGNGLEVELIIPGIVASS